jgi:hypothetical protein
MYQIFYLSDMLQKIRETRESLRQKTKEQLEMTTRRTIIENEQMTSELHYQSREKGVEA